MSAALLTRFEDRVAPARTALIVVDMQNDFCAEGGYIERVVGRSAAPCRAIVPALDRLIAGARAAHVPVVWIAANYRHDLIPPPALARQIERGWTDVTCAPGSWGHDFFGIRPAPGEALFEKSSFSPFHRTALEEHLRNRGIETLAVTGVQTNVCVDCTIRDGFVRGFYIAVPEDCVASHMPDLHTATLSTVKFLFGDVVPSTALLDRWRSGPQ